MDLGYSEEMLRNQTKHLESQLNSVREENDSLKQTIIEL